MLPEALFVELDDELRGHLRVIVEADRPDSDRAQPPARDRFRFPRWCGDFDDVEMAFIFSHDRPDGTEAWFQASPAEVHTLAARPTHRFPARLAG